jgi:ACS family allantoate permease-like MFS transporter
MSQFGYLFLCIPSAGLLQRPPMAKTISNAFIIWVLILIDTGFVRNFQTLIALRVLLGALEAPVAPGNFLMIAMWCTRKFVFRKGLLRIAITILIQFLESNHSVPVLCSLVCL